MVRVMALMTLLYAFMLFRILVQTVLTYAFTKLIVLLITVKAMAFSAIKTKVDIKLADEKSSDSAFGADTETVIDIAIMLETDIFIANITLIVFGLVSRVIISDFCGSCAFGTHNLIISEINVPIFAIFSNIMGWNITSVHMRTHNTVPTEMLIVPVYAIILFLIFLAN